MRSDVFLIRQDWELFGKEGRNGGDEADGRREAGQRDHNSQKAMPTVPKIWNDVWDNT